MPTQYIEDKKMLAIKENKAYTLADSMETKCIQNVSTDSDIDIDSDKGIDKKKNSHFVPPTLEEVQAYCKERNNNVDAQKFFDYFNTPDAQGRAWIDSKGNKVKNWKQKIITWEQHSGSDNSKKQETLKQNKFNIHGQRHYTPDQYADFERKLLNKGL
jgi:hypothetical protein